MRRLLLCLALVFLSGCFTTTPQSREEFKKWNKEHTTLGLHESYTVNRPFEEVAASLQKKWLQCYDVSATTRRTSGGMTTSNYTDTFHPRFKKIDKSHMELTLQVTTTGMIMLSKVPEGGDYVVALDLRRASKNKTDLTWYSYSWGQKEALEMSKAWAEGKDVPCAK